MNQDRRQLDLYQVLGVPRNADADAIKKAYRELARKLHPDVNQEPDAEERFKRVSEAYTVLSNPERRSAYDEFGAIALDPNFDVEKAREMQSAFGGFAAGPRDAGFEFGFGGSPQGADLGGLEDLLGDLFGGGAGGARARMRGRGADLRAEIDLPFVDAALGGEQRLAMARPDADGVLREENLRVRIPPGVSDGGRIRLAGKGAPGFGGGPDGDLLVTVRVRPHRVFRREGRDLHLDLPLTVTEASLGADVEVPTLDGRVKLSVPAGTDGGSKLRLRGKGIPAGGGHPAGDLYAHVRIRVPRDLDDAGREALDRISAYEPADIRSGLSD